MKRHLTEEELIKYRFKLAPDAQMEGIREHLAECEQCREHLERLEHKFSALDLLREDIEVSEELMSRVVEQASQPKRQRFVRFRMPVWIGAAAAVLVIGLLLVVSNLTDDKVPVPGIVKEPGPAKSVSKTVVDEKAKLARAGKESKGIEAELGRPPFAPASAIELVVLPRRDKVQLTIYNSADLTLVRERRNLTLKRGWNWLQFMWANTLIDPTSLSLEALEQGGRIDIQQLVFPARLRELGRWLIRSEVSGQVPFEITYLTSGLSWRAFYMGTLSEDEKTMQMKGYVRVANASGEDYEKARTRLIVGKVHILDTIASLAKRQYAYGSPIPVPGTRGGWGRAGGIDGRLNWNEFALDAEGIDMVVNAAMAMPGGFRPKEIKKEGLSEYFLYTIEGTETIADKWGKRLLSFEAEDIEVESLYKYDEERWGKQAIRFVKFANNEEHNLGDTPIPNGDVRIFGQADDSGSLSYIGGTSVKYIPVDEEVELNLGPARLVKLKLILMDFKTANYKFDKNDNTAGWDEIRTWKIEITNTRELPIDIEITRGFGTAYWTLVYVDIASVADNAISYEKYDATHARFELKLKPRSKRTFEYTVTTYHGVREEALTKKVNE